MSVIRRHETLSATKRELQRRLGRLEAEVERSQSSLQGLKQERGTKILVRVAPACWVARCFQAQMPQKCRTNRAAVRVADGH